MERISIQWPRSMIVTSVASSSQSGMPGEAERHRGAEDERDGDRERDQRHHARADGPATRARRPGGTAQPPYRNTAVPNTGGIQRCAGNVRRRVAERPREHVPPDERREREQQARSRTCRGTSRRCGPACLSWRTMVPMVSVPGARHGGPMPRMGMVSVGMTEMAMDHRMALDALMTRPISECSGHPTSTRASDGATWGDGQHVLMEGGGQRVNPEFSRRRPGAYPGAGGAEASGRYTITCTASRVINPPPIIWSSSGRIAWIRSSDSTHSTTTGKSSESNSRRSSPQAGARAEAHNCPVDRGACIMALPQELDNRPVQRLPLVRVALANVDPH